MDARNLMVNYVPDIVSTEEFIQIFEQFGHILHARIIRTPCGASKGYAFVHYVRLEDAKHALNELNGFPLYGKTLKVQVAIGSRYATLVPPPPPPQPAVPNPLPSSFFLMYSTPFEIPYIYALPQPASFLMH